MQQFFSLDLGVQRFFFHLAFECSGFFAMGLRVQRFFSLDLGVQRFFFHWAFECSGFFCHGPKSAAVFKNHRMNLRI